MDEDAAYHDLMIEVEWPEAADFPGAQSTGVRGLLTCGHYGSTCHEASSTWDHPAEAQTCPEGCGERQFDLRLQAHLMST